MPRIERTPGRIQPFVAACHYVVGEERRPGFLTDISTGGSRIHTDAEPPAVGTTLVLEVRLGRQATHLRIPATVRWERAVERGGFMFGLSFDTAGPEVEQILAGIVEEFRRRAASLG